MTKKRSAHTLVEMIVIVVILGAMAFVAVPRLQYASVYRNKAKTATKFKVNRSTFMSKLKKYEIN